MATNGNGRSDPGRQEVEQEMLRCLPRLKGFAISLGGDAVRAEDLVQQTVLQALAKLESFDPGTSMIAWLSTILRNRFYADYRKLRREQEWNPAFDNTMSFSTGLGEGQAEATYDFRRLLLYLACLSAEHSDALVAVGYLGMPYEEASERLGCAVGTIKSRVNRARTELATLMQGTVIKQVNLAKLKTATKDFPQGHLYFPIANAYEELYAACEDVSEETSGTGKVNSNGHADASVPSESEKAWQDLVASGALDDDEDLDVLVRSGKEEL